MSVQRRGNRYSSRVSVPTSLQPFVRREEVLRSLRTEDPSEARLRAQQWEAHLATLFACLRRNASAMTADQIDALVDQYLRTEIAEVEERLALDEWRANGKDWNALAQHLLAERAEEIEAALADNDLRRTIEEARTMLPGGEEDMQLFKPDFTLEDLELLMSYEGIADALRKETDRSAEPERAAGVARNGSV